MNVGLTGGIGCGKSTALQLFANMGAQVLDVDALVRQLLDNDAELIDQLVGCFGNTLLGINGKIDRAVLGRTVFTDPAALALLESMVHPRVRQQWMQALREEFPLLVIEIPLLFEKDLQRHFERTLCVACSTSLQQHRLLQRGMTLLQIEQRIANQLPLEEKMRRADTVLWNAGDRKHLLKQIQHWQLAVGASSPSP